MNPFERFGLEHVTTLIALVAVAILLSWVLRRSHGGFARVRTAVRFGLAGLLSFGLVFALADALPIRRLDWLDVLPLHFCDLAVLIAVWALLTRRQIACEILYFWGLSGTVIAMLTPDVDHGFPDSRCLSFFALHGGVAVSAAVLAFGHGVRPRPRADLHVFWLTNAYAAIIGVIDAVAHENYLYLRAKPSQPSLLDVMGPWPWYILAADALGFVLFKVLMIPFSNHKATFSHR
ncbi:MAG: TIGR02206 family membrane protein [Candidatus Eisenbacteria bacterium]|uniref:TIGR02206 family membrane protein n=1 Tax=Eiseniibacteriota bacterium TaxID=2212470 RepID=A0A538SZU0_UNCEI|nr:MAG: TIGR02206 family membrane protein [Candidatus Eisenbacteria bacterium]